MAHGRRPKQRPQEGEEVPGPAGGSIASLYTGSLSAELSGKQDELLDLDPDPAHPPESLLADSEWRRRQFFEQLLAAILLCVEGASASPMPTVGRRLCHRWSPLPLPLPLPLPRQRRQG